MNADTEIAGIKECNDLLDRLYRSIREHRKMIEEYRLDRPRVELLKKILRKMYRWCIVDIPHYEVLIDFYQELAEAFETILKSVSILEAKLSSDKELFYAQQQEIERLTKERDNVPYIGERDGK